MLRRILLAIVALCVGAILVYGFWPIVDRTQSAARPSAMPVFDGDLPNADRIREFARAEARGIDALVIHRDGALALEFGAVSQPMNLGSVRKSVLSLLYGIAHDRGLIDLDRTLSDLGIDETDTPLTPTERRATIEHLLQSRSGVYLQSGGETALTVRTRPERGQYDPGEAFFYNNWDFNVLGVVFEQETGLSIGQALDEWLAREIGMEDYHPSHVYFDRWGSTSDHPTYRMFMSARDLARLGTLVLNDGLWDGRRILSQEWLARSMAPHSQVGPPLSRPPFDGFGYSWWLNTETGDVVASGWGGQYLYVDVVNRATIVARRDTGNTLLGHLWFRQFTPHGRPEDLLRILGYLDGA